MTTIRASNKLRLWIPKLATDSRYPLHCRDRDRLILSRNSGSRSYDVAIPLLELSRRPTFLPLFGFRNKKDYFSHRVLSVIVFAGRFPLERHLIPVRYLCGDPERIPRSGRWPGSRKTTRVSEAARSA